MLDIDESAAKSILERLAKWHGCLLVISDSDVHFHFSCGNNIIAWEIGKLHGNCRNVMPNHDAKHVKSCKELLYAYIHELLFLEVNADEWSKEFSHFRQLKSGSLDALFITLDAMGI